MEDNHYKTDKLAVFEQQQVRASEALVSVEKRSEAAPIAFLKANYSNEKIRDRSKDIDFKMMLALALTKICGYAGIKTEVTDFDSGDISRMILSAYNDLSLEEIYKAFELERYGTYEDKTEHFQLFNAEYVATILKKYKKWRQETKVQHNISPPQQLPEITESQKDEIARGGLVRVFDEYKATGAVPEPSAWVFDALYEYKIIPDATTPELQSYYQRKYNEATAKIQDEMHNEAGKNAFDPVKVRAVKEEIERLNAGYSDKVAVLTKKLILADYFKKLVDKGKHLSEVLP